MSLLNIFVLIFEVIYYSLFMKSARPEGKISRYLLLFTLITLVLLILRTNNLLCYLFVVLLILYGLKYIVKLKISLYDMMFIFMMLITKLILETPFYLMLNNCLPIEIISLISGTFKILFVLIFSKYINIVYKKLKKLWNNNNFYIRYLFSIFMFIYVILSCVFIIGYYL